LGHLTRLVEFQLNQGTFIMTEQVLFTRFNIHIQNKLSAKDLAKLQDDLFNAATWATADDPEVFFEEKSNVMGVSIETINDPLSLVEAGAILGQCQLAYEKSRIDAGPTWLSIHDKDGEVLDSPYAP
jgi:hypothetical protein